MTIKLLPVLFLVFFSTISSNAQTTPEAIANKFFSIYKDQNSDSALNYLFSLNNYYDTSNADISNLREKLRKAAQICGVFCGYDIILKKSAGENCMMLTLLVRHEKAPLTFRVFFYKPSIKWQIMDFKYNNNIDDELEEASKKF